MQGMTAKGSISDIRQFNRSFIPDRFWSIKWKNLHSRFKALRLKGGEGMSQWQTWGTVFDQGCSHFSLLETKSTEKCIAIKRCAMIRLTAPNYLWVALLAWCLSAALQCWQRDALLRKNKRKRNNGAVTLAAQGPLSLSTSRPGCTLIDNVSRDGSANPIIHE